MPLEIEAKFRVESHDAVRERLRVLSASFLERVVERNQIFDRPDGWLESRGRGLRVRWATNELGQELPAVLTVKGPRQPGAFKSREEIELAVGDAAQAALVLERLGYVPILTYEKRRESWRLGPCRVELDEPPRVGRFVEIEGPSEEAVARTQRDLGLEGATHLPASYVRMLIAWCNEHGQTERVLRLDNPAGT